MIDEKKIITMIEKIGPTKLDILMNWFPQYSKDEMKEKVDSSNILQFDENEIVSLSIVSMGISDITYEQLLEIIAKYNDKTRKEFNEKYNMEELKKEAIKKYLEEKFILEKDLIKEEYECYVATNKRNNNKNYIVICKDYDEAVAKDITDNFTGKEAQIFYEEVSTSTSSLEDFYFRDSKEIIRQMINKFELIEEPVSIYKIAKQ